MIHKGISSSSTMLPGFKKTGLSSGSKHSFSGMADSKNIIPTCTINSKNVQVFQKQVPLILTLTFWKYALYMPPHVYKYTDYQLIISYIWLRFWKKRKLGWLIIILHFWAEFTFKDKSQILRLESITQLSMLPGLWDKAQKELQELFLQWRLWPNDGYKTVAYVKIT